MNLHADEIERLAAQELALHLPRFDLSMAWSLGSTLRALAQVRELGLAIEVRMGGRTVFANTMPGATAVNEDWVRRKRNTTELFERSSYAVGRMLERDEETLTGKMGLPHRDYASFGGSFPIRVRDTGCVGTVTVSGLPQRDDHELVVEVMAPLCGVEPCAIALPPL